MPLIPQLAALTNPFTWRRPAANVRRLWHFARAERNTLIELEQAANLTPDPTRAAAYLQHGSDEGRHARMFVAHARKTAREHGLDPVSAPHSDTAHLYTTLGEVGFLAFMHHGEGRGRRQFTTYRDHLKTRDARGSAMFDAILVDELQHETYSGTLLHELGDGAPALRRVRAWELWRTVRGLQQGTAATLFTVSFALLTPMLALLSLWTRTVRPARTGW